MRSDLTKKAFLGLGPLMIPLPGFILRNEIRRSARAIRQGTDHLTPEERKVHRFVVRSVTASSQPVSLGDIVRGLSLPLSRVEEIVNQLEDLKVFFYRYNNPGINWAYPVTAEEREYKLTFSSGEGCTAA